MSILVAVKRLLTPRTMNDPYFGILQFREAGFWEGDMPFAPVGRDIAVTINAPETGPHQDQRVFMNEVQRRYVALLPAICAALSANIGFDDLEFENRPIFNEFRLKGIDVPDCRMRLNEWELTYYCLSAECYLDVQMLDWEVGEVSVGY